MNSISNDLKNVVFYFIGENHRDPSPKGLIRNLSKALYEDHIPQMYCCEHPSSLSLSDKYQKEKLIFNYVKLLFQDPGLQSVLKNPNQYANVEESIRTYLNKKFPEQLTYNKLLAAAILQIEGAEEQSELDLQLLNLKIPFQGLSDSQPDEIAYNIYASNDINKACFDLEDKRIAEFINNLFNKALPQIAATGGIIWVNTGALHVSHLAVAVFTYIQKQELTKDFSFSINPTFCSAKHLKESINALLQIYQEKPFLKNLDSSLYTKFDAKLITDIDGECLGKYSSLEFLKLFEFGKKFYKKTNIFHIPNFTEAKAKLIKKLHGKVLESSESSAKVAIASEVLVDSIREKLEIDRQKVTFKKNVSIKEKEFQSYSQFTIEPTANPNSLLLTFPSQDLSIVENIVKGKTSL